MDKANGIECLYHYCSTSNMASIVCSHQLWMCDIRKSNDFEEMQLFLPGVFYEAEELYKLSPFPFQYKNFKNLDAIRNILMDVDSFIQEAFANGALSSYVSCFCEKGDDLNLWRGYAEDGRGCALGFSFDLLQLECQKSNGVIRLEKVKYCSREQLNTLIKRKARTLITEIKKLKKAIKDLPTSLDDEAIYTIMCVLLYGKVEAILVDSLRYKQECFKSEKEWRLYIPNSTKNTDLLYGNAKIYKKEKKETVDLLRDKLEIREKDSDLVSFFPIDITNAFLRNIVCGPKNRMSRADFFLFMAKYGFKDVEMNRSKISYC